MSERVLLANVHLVVTVDFELDVVRLVRTAEPFAHPLAAARVFREANLAMEGVDRSRFGMLVDLRAAPGRNDPQFEEAIAPVRRELYTGFARRAALVKTTTGRLQEERLSREQRTAGVYVFHDENEALSYAAGLLEPRMRSVGT